MKIRCALLIAVHVTFAKSLNETSNGNGKNYFFKMKQNSSDFIISSRIPNLGPKELVYPVIQKKLTNVTAANQEPVKNFTKDILDEIDAEETATKRAIITSRIPHLGPKQLEYPVIQKKTVYQTTVTEDPRNVTEDYEDNLENVSGEAVDNATTNILKAIAAKSVQEYIIPEAIVTERIMTKKNALFHRLGWIDPKVIKEFTEQITKFGEACMEETKATGDDVAQLIAHQSPTTHEGKCMISCIYKAFGIQNDDGTMNSENTLKLISVVKESDPEVYDQMETIFKNCQNTAVDEDPCITALNVAECYIKEGKATGLKDDIFGI